MIWDTLKKSLLAELGQRIGPGIPPRGHAGVFVRKAGDLDIGELEIPDHPVENHGGMRPVDRIVVEMGVGRHGDVDGRFRKLLLEPQPPGA